MSALASLRTRTIFRAVAQEDPLTIHLPKRALHVARSCAKRRIENLPDQPEKRPARQNAPAPHVCEDQGPSREMRQLIGILGEMAFPDYAGVNSNIRTDRPDPGYDYIVRWKGKTQKVDVKTTTHSTGRLIVEEGKVKANVYVLATILNPEAVTFDGDLEEIKLKLVGYATAEEVKEHPPKEQRYGDDAHTVGQSELAEMPPRDQITEFENKPPWEREQ